MFDTAATDGRLVEIVRSVSERTLNVGSSAPEPQALKLQKAEVAIERGSVLIDRIHHHRPRTELACAAYAPPKRVDAEIAAEARPALSPVKRKPRQEDDRHWVCHPSPKPRGRAVMRLIHE